MSRAEVRESIAAKIGRFETGGKGSTAGLEKPEPIKTNETEQPDETGTKEETQ